MAALIDRVRFLTNDAIVPGGLAQFDERQIQDALDRFRTDVRYMELREEETLQKAPLPTIWLDYYDDGRGDWEEDGVLVMSDWSVVTPATSDWLTGHWTFSSNQYPPVYITGKSYDIHMSAAWLIENYAASQARQYDFTADGATFRRSQLYAGLTALANSLRSKARPRMTYTGRTDAGRGW
jgi:hypothetical protein